MQRRVFVGSVAAAVILAAAVIGAQLGSLRVARGDPPAPSWPPYYAGLPTAGTIIGRADAPVLVEEYFDFQCPHCQTASEELVRPIIERYVRRGEARFAYRFFPILGPESVLAAQAAYCSAREGAFWPYQHLLFMQRGTGNQGTYSRENLIAHAGAVGLAEEAFARCLEGEEALVYVRGWYERAVRMGLAGTPTFAVNGAVVPVTSLDSLERAIEAALEASRDA